MHSSWVIFFSFQVFSVKEPNKLNQKFRIVIQYIPSKQLFICLLFTSSRFENRLPKQLAQVCQIWPDFCAVQIKRVQYTHNFVCKGTLIGCYIQLRNFFSLNPHRKVFYKADFVFKHSSNFPFEFHFVTHQKNKISGNLY